MRVTRDVIYDLLPAYFAGEVSDDTRALVDAYFETDPEFARMATRFQALIADRRRDGPDAEAVARERETFDCARKAADLPQKARAIALVWGFASLLSFGVALLTWKDRMAGWWNPGVLIGICFGAVALATFALSFRATPESWWRAAVGFDDRSLERAGLGRRRVRRARIGL